MDPDRKFAKYVDHAIDKLAEDVGYTDVEKILQARAQDMRELAYDEGDTEAVTGDYFEGDGG